MADFLSSNICLFKLERLGGKFKRVLACEAKESNREAEARHMRGTNRSTIHRGG